jgi:aspartyl protease family protein
MTDSQAPNALYLLLCLVLVATSLVGMRLPLGKVVKMAAAWVGIFAVAFAILSFRGEFSALGQRLKAEALGTPIAAGETLRIPMADDGHFYVNATINNRPVRFMVDSGATITTVSMTDAQAAGMTTDGRRVVVNTANGPAPVTQSYADRLQVGEIERTDFPVDVSPQEDMNLLGMNFLSSLGSWRVEGSYLVLQP